VNSEHLQVLRSTIDRLKSNDFGFSVFLRRTLSTATGFCLVFLQPEKTLKGEETKKITVVPTTDI